MGEYIMDMRSRVGHIPLMQCGASVILENEQGEILLEKRSDNGEWAYAGGAVELYERVEEAAARELREETGLIAEKLELLGIFSGERLHYIYPNGDEVSNVDVVFVCRNYHGTLKGQPGEVETLRFFPIDALPEPIFSVNQPALETYLNMKKHENRSE